MALNPINLDVMARLARKQADHRLSRYLCNTLAPLLPRLPSTPQCMPAFVEAAGKEAIAVGYSDGRRYSTHVTLSLLLGLGWQNDIHHATLNPILTAAGLPEPTRLNLAINTAITLRQQTERVMPQAHQIFITLLSINPGALQAENIWRAFEQSASRYGINTPQRIQTLFETYETDALHQLKLPPVRRQQYSAYELLGMRHMTGRIRLPSDDLQHLQLNQLLCLGHHVLLALSFGRFFYCNPLFTVLHDGLYQKTDPRQICHFLLQFLRQHRRALMEEAPNDD
ncbi:hypothetical protein [Brenneria rubrifaciens]|uniref:Uncharacterized protein n=1 Tax=Brenneria rubrifaciens TaxID=55213 RepID=A0A4P8QUU8_9GAMM|nr:hypothetical protein [Brenneria rubrifaciens]QCR07114.1 hypothetical protein EH207_00210 [Brenneria rubrifaciens]